MKIDLDQIEAVALGAKEDAPSPWIRMDGGIGSVVVSETNDTCVADCWGEDMAAHVATFSPDVVLALVRVAKAAVRAAADIRSDTPDGGASQYRLLRAVAALDGDE